MPEGGAVGQVDDLAAGGGGGRRRAAREKSEQATTEWQGMRVTQTFHQAAGRQVHTSPASPRISPRLPTSPHISPHLPTSSHIPPSVPFSPRQFSHLLPPPFTHLLIHTHPHPPRGPPLQEVHLKPQERLPTGLGGNTKGSEGYGELTHGSMSRLCYLLARLRSTVLERLGPAGLQWPEEYDLGPRGSFVDVCSPSEGLT